MAVEYKIIGGDGREYGPATLEEIRQWCEEGRVAHGTPVWRGDEQRWQPALAWDELKWDLPPLQQPAELPTDSTQPAPPIPGASPVWIGTVSAGFWIRFAAYVLDWVILTSLVTLLTLPWAEPLGKLQTEAMAQLKSANPDTQVLVRFWLISLAINLPIGFLFYTYFNGLRGATPGKQILGLRIIREDGSKLGFGGAAIRYLAGLLSGLTFGIGYLLIAFHPQKRALHDLIARTRVVKKM